jgi:uncharacterized membrane protein
VTTLATGGAAIAGVAPERAAILGFDAGAIVFVLSSAPLWRRADSARLRARAAAEDAGRGLLLIVTALAAAAVLAAVGVLAAGKASMSLGDLGLTVGTLALAWTFVNLVYAFHYAHLYYAADQTEPPLVFPGSAAPCFSDFCYFSFVLGMTFQVSDVAIASPRLRQVATAHAALAFFFNIGVLSLTVNVVAGAL